jgi:hypothetical protein
MTPEEKNFARDWYDPKLTVEQIADKWDMSEGSIRVWAVEFLRLGPRTRWTKRDGTPYHVDDRRKEVGL